MCSYLTVESDGFVTYCDALVARFSGATGQAIFLSLVGSPSHVQAASAHFFNGGLCHVTDAQGKSFSLGRGCGVVHSSRARKIGEIVNKVLISAAHFTEEPEDSQEAVAVVFGPDLDTVIERAFLHCDSRTAMPLKPQWQGWLWEEILHPERLYCFGNRELREAWLISWREESLEEAILEGVRQKYLL